MIWQQPIAWVGLMALALPVIIHLLGRGHTRSARFPTLRFIQHTRLLPTRRTRLRDLLLFAVRVATLAAAVAALAQPLWSTPERTRAFTSTLSRAVVIDTSAGDERASATRLAMAQHLADSASVHVLIVTGSPERVLTGAVSWLQQQPTRAELVVVSDFPTGQISAEQLASIPRDIGVRLVRPATGGTRAERASSERATVSSSVMLGAATIDVRTTLSGVPAVLDSQAITSATSVAWVSRLDGVYDDTTALALMGDATEQSALARAHAAARRSIALPVRSARAGDDDPEGVTIVTPQAPDRAELLRASIPVRSPWMLDAVAALHAHPLLHSAISNTSPIASSDSVAGIPVITDRHGVALVVAREGIINGQHRLLLLSRTAAANFSTAALIAAARDVHANRRRVEREPSLVPDSFLGTWQRAPSSERRVLPANVRLDIDQGPSDARWVWVAALVLIGAEQLLRRNARSATEPP